MDRPSPIVAKRYFAPAPVHLQFPGEEQPLSARLGNLSEKGLFVISEITYPASTEFNFRVNDPDPRRAITGRGRVAWRRQLAAGEHRPAGMGCQILRLTADSREALERRLIEHQDAEMFRQPPDRRSLTQEISRHDIREAMIAEQVQRPEYFRTMAGGRGRRGKPKLGVPFWILGGVALLVVAAFGLASSGIVTLPTALRWPPSASAANTPAPTAESPRLTEDPGSVAIVDRQTNPNGADSSTDVAMPSQSSAQVSPKSVASRLKAPARTEAIELLRVWSSSWSSQAVDDYLACYSKRFSPGQMSRAAWMRDRRAKLSSPRYIEVSVSQVRFSEAGERAILTFNQSYRSNLMQDRVEKTLELVRESDRWRILSETASPLS